MKFLSAHWNHLLLANYSIESSILEKYIPKKTSLDLFEGHVFVSLVAFMFNKTKVLGIPFPGHTNFEEVNLRFYVKPDHDKTLRAVTFIKEIVPKAIIPPIANHLFYENYISLPMSHSNTEFHHSYSWVNNIKNEFSATILNESCYPEESSINEFITEHYWGYAKGKNKTLEYKVEHPQWECCEATDYTIHVDFKSTYGPEFEFLNDLKPYNVLYAKGSEITVSSPRRF